MKKRFQIVALLSMLVALFASCDDSKSYAELLEEEDEAIKAFFADKWVINEVPADSVFITLADAKGDTLKVPYYKMDRDGNTYMQVLDAGEKDDRFEVNDYVNVRFERFNLKELMSGSNPTSEGNTNPLDPIKIRFGSTSLTSTTQYGLGIQVPLQYLGDYCKVNLVVRSKYGFTSEVSYVIPYLYKSISYIKSQS